MAIRFQVTSATGDTVDVYQLSSGLSPAIDPSRRDDQPFEGSDVFKTLDGRDVHQSRPGVFVVAGSAIEYQRVVEE